MGIDFLRKTAKPFQRSWDRARQQLENPGLFDRDLTPARRLVAVSPVDAKHPLEVGKEYAVRSLGQTQIGVYDCVTLVATGAPSQELLKAIDAGGGVALGITRTHHPISGCADLEVK